MLEEEESEDEDVSDSDDDSDSSVEEDVDMADTRRSRRAVGDEGDWVTMEQDEGGLKQQTFDTYVKGNITKTSMFFKTSEAAAPRYRMFPYVERKRRIDDFGEIVDVSAWLRKGKIFDANAESEEMKALKLRKSEQLPQVSSVLSQR